MQRSPDSKSNGPILVPVDFSPQSRVAVLTASELAGSSPVPFLLLHVIHENGEQAGFYRERDNGSRMRPLADIARELLDQFLAELRFDNPDVPRLNSAHTKIGTGLPSQRILEVADPGVNARRIQ